MKEVRIFTEETFYYGGEITERHGKDRYIEVPNTMNREKLVKHWYDEDDVFEEEIDTKIPFFIYHEFYGLDLENEDETLFINPQFFNSYVIFNKEWLKQLNEFMYREKYILIIDTQTVFVCEPSKQIIVLEPDEKLHNHRELRKWLKKHNHI